LSRRCIYFWKDNVYFQCNKHILCEVGGEARCDWDERDPVFAHNPLSKLPPRSATAQMRRRWDLDIYKSIIERYTKRVLSYPSDIQNAFAGLTSVLEGHFEGKLLHGLPGSVFDLVLLWTPAARLKS
jgi:hypothetical protein